MLDAPEPERYLPRALTVEALELDGSERVVDYGAGTGRLTRAVAERLQGGGKAIALDESPETYELLVARLDGTECAYALHIVDNDVPLADGSVQRVLAVDLLHEVRGESALAEMRRLLATDGFVLVVDWERGHTRTMGPPDELLYTVLEAEAVLQAVGLVPLRLDLPLPFTSPSRPHDWPRNLNARKTDVFRRSTFSSLSSSEAAAGLKGDKLQLVDVREPAELTKARIQGEAHSAQTAHRPAG